MIDRHLSDRWLRAFLVLLTLCSWHTARGETLTLLDWSAPAEIRPSKIRVSQYMKRVNLNSGDRTPEECRGWAMNFETPLTVALSGYDGAPIYGGMGDAELGSPSKSGAGAGSKS